MAIEDDLKFWFDFEDAGNLGLNPVDEDAVTFGTPTQDTNGKVGAAITNNNVANSLRIGNFADPPGSLTIACWWKPDNLTTRSIILSRYVNSPASDQSYMLSFEPGFGLRLALYNPFQIAQIPEAELTAGQWDFIVAGLDSPTGDLYISKNLETPYVTSTSRSQVPQPVGNQLWLGRWNGSSFSLGDGRADSVAMWHRTLDSTEHIQLYNGGRGIDYEGLNPPPRFGDIVLDGEIGSSARAKWNQAIQTANDWGMFWRGAWPTEVDPHLKGDVVRDGAWLMIANKETTDRPAPQPLGPSFFIYDGTLAAQQVSAKVVYFGSRYYFPDQGGLINGYRVDVVAGDEYKVYAIENPTSTPITNLIADFTAQTTGWVSFNTGGTLIPRGAYFDLLVQATEPNPAPVIWSSDWNYTTPNNTGVPGSGVIIHANRAASEFRINKTDFLGDDRSTELGAMAIGDTITGAGTEWIIQSITDNVTWINFAVAPATQGSPDGVQKFDFETVTDAPIPYGRDTGYWSGNANIRGLFAADGDPFAITPSDDAYGADIEVQDISVSPDWDLLALGVISPTGGGGGTAGTNDINTDDMSNNIPDWIEMAAGDVPGYSMVNKSGRNTDIDTSTDPEDIWEVGGLWVPPTDARIHDFVSDDSADSAAGSGARTLRLMGLDSNWDEIEETIVMNGTTPVPTANAYIRIYFAQVITAGTSQFNEGTITGTAQTDGTVSVQISPEMGRSLQAVFIVPAGFEAYVIAYYGSLARDNPQSVGADLALRVVEGADDPEAAMITRHQLGVMIEGANPFRHEFQAPIIVPEKSDIILRCERISDNNSALNGGFEVVLKKL